MIIVWDFNGTILDDVDLCIDIENKMMRDHGYGQVTRDRYLEIFRFPVSDYYLDLGVDFNDYSYEQISIDFHKDYRARRQEAKIMDDFHDTIRKAKRLGYGNVILSASREDILIEQCEELGIREEFDELLGINDLYASSKVGRGLAFKAAHPDKMVMLGDSVHDFEVAKELGIDCWLIARGHQSKRKLLEVTDQVVDSLSELPMEQWEDKQ